MEELFQYICVHAIYAHYLFFGLLLLSGFNVPISEDLMLLMAGVIANLCLPDTALHLYAWLLAGCIISGWEAYWLGRLFGMHLYKIPFLKSVVTPEKIHRLQGYYERFGVFTFIVGRFIPCGFRNALFITAGMGKMPFVTFIWRDFFGAVIASATLYFIGYQSASFADELFLFFHRFEFIGMMCILILITLFSAWRFIPSRRPS